MRPPILKYPRTPHLSGSELQRGDSPETVPFRQLVGRQLVVEEKLDGANSAISFTASGELLLQSRGHYLAGGGRERHFALLKTWAEVLRADLHDVLGARYILYGEWLYAKHTVFYDLLPHYFHEFDVFDRQDQVFLSTPARRALLEGLEVVSVPVLYDGPGLSEAHLLSLVARSLYKSAEWRASMAEAVQRRGQHIDIVQRQTEDCDLSEGLYVKWEDDENVLGRYKYVRPGFVQSLMDAEGHWQRRPILPNGLAEGASLYGGGS
jgi:hypothetical protein